STVLERPRSEQFRAPASASAAEEEDQREHHEDNGGQGTGSEDPEAENGCRLRGGDVCWCDGPRALGLIRRRGFGLLRLRLPPAVGTVAGAVATGGACGAMRAAPTTGSGAPCVLPPLCPAPDSPPASSRAAPAPALASRSSARMSAATPATIGAAKEQPCPSA